MRRIPEQYFNFCCSLRSVMAMFLERMEFKVVLLAMLLPCLWTSVMAGSTSNHSFVIENDLFLKDGIPFRILGGELHYFRVHPQLWEDRLLRVKSLGLNTIQTYVPWNLHEPRPGHLNFNGSADLLSFLKLAHRLDLLVMLRIGPYMCGEWDLGGLPAWLLELKPSVRLRSSDAQYLARVDNWWKELLPMVAPELFLAGGPVIMVQAFSSTCRCRGLQHWSIPYRYTTDGAVEENIRDGSLPEAGVLAAINFQTGSDPASAFALQKRHNPPGMSPPLATEFYTGWLSHWGEKLAKTDAKSTAEALDNILRLNASVVLYMVHGGTNFGFFSGANTGTGPSDFQPDITSYDYDAPIGEAGDVGGVKYQEIRNVLSKYAAGRLPDPPPLPQRTAYGEVTMKAMGSLFDVLKVVSTPPGGMKLEWPMPMEQLRQGSGFILYRSYLPAYARPGSRLSVVEVYDRAQVFVGSATNNRIFLGTLERWSRNTLTLPASASVSGLQLDILVENMGRVNYGLFIGENKGITEAVLLDDYPILGWSVHTIGLDSVGGLKPSAFQKTIPPHFELDEIITTKIKRTPQLVRPFVDLVNGPVFYEGTLNVTQPSDTFMSLRGWNKGVAFINGFNLGRFWPSMGPQCTLYIPGPLLQPGQNKLILLELESSSPVQTIDFTHTADFTCGIQMRA
ncbi:beta-galactosidase 8 isoform X2 [Physcomitrium patens]|uniref:beta-galactosidase 8 isoform X2 n=1 Tax=Physcomitrium patens TaxID=3218 RepID=UPI000D162917|nr:beta-galactosidase 8-like isoform X2 [Physcomitrium patens]|eukprot:XP_024366649.1 beta-galactosidase 8-like isoform X2 [Physcomitrella patens]